MRSRGAESFATSPCKSSKVALTTTVIQCAPAFCQRVHPQEAGVSGAIWRGQGDGTKRSSLSLQGARSPARSACPVALTVLTVAVDETKGKRGLRCEDAKHGAGRWRRKCLN